MEENKSLTPQGEEQLFAQIKQMLDEARRRIAHAVNTTTVAAYWQVGKYIVEYEQQGKARAEYGKGVIKTLSKRLMAEYGGGFTTTNLKVMRQFYLCYPKGHAVRDQLSWTHWRTLLTVQNEAARNYYISECVAENWSTRQLERQVNTMFYERMLASRDKATVKVEIQTTAPKVSSPRELIRDPYIYTLPKDEKQVFAAKYMTYLPTQEELRQLLYDE